MLQFYRCWNLSSPSLFQTLRYPWEETSRCLVSSAIWEITKYLNLICNWFLSLLHVFSSLFIWHDNSSFNCWFLVRFLTSKRSQKVFIVGSSVTRDTDIKKKLQGNIRKKKRKRKKENQIKWYKIQFLWREMRSVRTLLLFNSHLDECHRKLTCKSNKPKIR